MTETITGSRSGARRVIFLCYLLSAALALVAVVAGRWTGPPALFARWTAEGGLFETASVLALVAGAAWLFRRAIHEGGGRRRIVLAGLAFLMLAAGLEEMSWGQRLIGFGTPELLAESNRQGEANLHNLLDAELFAILVHTPVWLLFVFLPLAVALRPGWRALPGLRRVPGHWWPGPHAVLMFCFGGALQAWRAPVTWPDRAALVTALALLALALVTRPEFRRPLAWPHWIFVVASAAVFRAASDIFEYENAQYEIRELVVVLGFLFWLSGVLARGRTLALEGEHGSQAVRAGLRHRFPRRAG